MYLGIIESTSPLSIEEAAAILADYFRDVYGCWVEDCDEDAKWTAYLWNESAWKNSMIDAGLDEEIHGMYGDEWEEIRDIFDFAIDLDGRLFAQGDTFGFADEPIAMDMYSPDPDNICSIFVYGE